MAEYIVEINQDNTIDLPMDVRNKMRLHPGDKMMIRLDDDQMIVGKYLINMGEKAQDIRNGLHETIEITD